MTSRHSVGPEKVRIVTLIDFYVPGFRAGGPVKSIVNLISMLGDEFKFEVITSDRDLGMDEPYKGVLPNSPRKVGRGVVFYCSRNLSGFFFVIRRLSVKNSKIFYFNSFFSSRFSIFPFLFLSVFRPSVTKILAPRGEFSVGALSIKSARKRVFIRIAILLRIYRNIVWHASNEIEKEDIRRVFGNTANIRIASDLAVSEWRGGVPDSKQENSLRVIFVSRICRMKNILAIAEIMSEVRCNTSVDIYGPIEDIDYWREFLARVEDLPLNISVNYRGIVAPHEVIPTIARYDLFLLPTLGENFGHVIAEALFAGVPILISDRSPWRDINIHNLGWSLPLEDLTKFSSRIEECAKVSSLGYFEWRKSIQAWAKNNVSTDAMVKCNREIFQI